MGFQPLSCTTMQHESLPGRGGGEEGGEGVLVVCENVAQPTFHLQFFFFLVSQDDHGRKNIDRESSVKMFSNLCFTTAHTPRSEIFN